jgi:hypothetical protein
MSKGRKSGQVEAAKRRLQIISARLASVITSKPTISYRVKTGQWVMAGTPVFTLPGELQARSGPISPESFPT